MTLEEAKKILKKEVFGIRFKKFDKPLKFEEKLWIRNEKPEVLEALHIVAKNGIGVSVPETTLRIRRLIIKKMKAGEGEPAPVSGTPLTAAEGMKLQWKDNKNTDKNPALAESASQFNDVLLDEQAKKIAELTKENDRLERVSKTTTDEFNELYYRMITKSDKIEALGKEIARLNKIIHKKNLKIEELGKESSRHLEGKMKMFGENFGLEQKLKDKDAVLADVAEELRLSKIREKNLTELCQKYVKANEELKEKLANKVVDKIDAQALKSAESALAWKEKLIYYKDMAIADLRKELKAQKGLVNHISKKYDGAKINLNLRMKECEKLEEALDEANKHQQQAYRSCTDKNNEIRALKLQISALEKRGNGIDWKRNADAIKLYVNRASHERLWNPISQDICNEKELSFIINHGGKRVKYALHFDGTDIVYECSDPDKKNNDLMVGADIAEEGGDNSGVIVLCGKDFIDAIKKMK